MGALILPSRFNQQPSQAAPIDWSLPVTRGLASLACGSSGNDAARNISVKPTAGAVTVVPTIHGLGWQGSSTIGGVDIGASGGIGSILDQTKGLSWFSRIYISNITTRQYVIADFNSSGVTVCFDLQITAAGRLILETYTGSSYPTVDPGFFPSVGWHDIEVEITASPTYTQTLYVDGVLVGSTTAGAGLSLNAGTTLRLMSPGAFSSFPFLGQMAISAFWSRNRNSAERALVRDNPWQMFKAAPRRLWVTSSGSNVSVALSGQAATSSAGSIIPSIDKPLVGSSSTASAGSVSTGGDVSVALAGQAANASAGALTAGSAIGLSGSSGSSAAGSLTPSGSVALMGQAAAGAQGAVGVVGDVTVALTGLAMVMALGQLSVSQATGAGRPRRKFQVETSRGIIEVDTLDEVAEVARAEKRVPKAKNVEVKLAGIKVSTPSLKPNLDYRAIEDRMRAQVQAEIDDEEELLLMML